MRLPLVKVFRRNAAPVCAFPSQHDHGRDHRHGAGQEGDVERSGQRRLDVRQHRGA